MKCRKIEYVSKSGNSFSILYHRVRHWRYRYSGIFQRITDRFWCSWSVFVNPSTLIDRGFEPMFLTRRSMLSRLRSTANRWEAQNH